MESSDEFQLKKKTSKILIQAPGHAKSLGRIRTLVSDLARKVGFPEGEVDKIAMAVDEACANVVEHAYAPTKKWLWKHRDPQIRLEVRAEAGKLVVEINDHGQRFDFEKYAAPKVADSVRQMKTGGFGISIIRQFMDEVHYSSSNKAGNTLRLVKNLKKS